MVGFVLLRVSAAAARAADTLPKKISSLTLKTFGPEVTVCYPVKRNKCMSDLGKCWSSIALRLLVCPSSNLIG